MKIINKKILYIFLSDYTEISGVTKKIKGLISEMDKSNLDYTFFAMNSKCEEIGFQSQKFYFLPANYINKQKELYDELDSFLNKNNFDVIIFRYPLANEYLLNLIEKHPNKFVFEHNTKELDEIKHQALKWVHKFKFKISPSYLKLIYNTLVKPIYIERFYGKRILKLAKGGIAVTNEIKKYEELRVKGYKCNTIANGIEIANVPFYERHFKNGDVLNLVMLVSSKVDWHGIDLIIESFNKYNKNNINLFLIGNLSEKELKLSFTNKNIIHTGFLSPIEYQKYIQLAHIGLGSFALYRKNLEEASTLKVREYLASGLPLFLGHIDTDVENSILKKYSFNVNMPTHSIDWESIYLWAVNLYSDEKINEKIRLDAYSQIDFSNKLSKLLLN